jgi:hypothetical protein
MAESFVSPTSESSIPSPLVPVQASPSVQLKTATSRLQPLHTLHTDEVSGDAWLLCRTVTDEACAAQQLCTVHVKIIDGNVYPRPSMLGSSETADEFDEYSAKLVSPNRFVDRLPPSFADALNFRPNPQPSSGVWCTFRVFPPLLGPAVPSCRMNPSACAVAVRPFPQAKKWALQLCALVGKMYQTRSDRIVLQRSAVLVGFDGTLTIDVTAALPFSSVRVVHACSSVAFSSISVTVLKCLCVCRV